MATSNSESVPRRKRPRLGSRFQMEVNFPDDDSKKKFLGRLEKAKGLLFSAESHIVVDNFRLLSTILRKQ